MLSGVALSILEPCTVEAAHREEPAHSLPPHGAAKQRSLQGTKQIGVYWGKAASGITWPPINFLGLFRDL